jgi:hypothetical protein
LPCLTTVHKVAATLVCANSTGGCSGVSSSTVNLALSSFTYHDGETTQASTNTAASVITPNHVLVASKPTITMAQTSTTGFGNGTVKIGEFTIAADAAGDIAVKAIPITVSVAGAGTTTAGSIELRDKDGNAVIAGSNALNGSGTFTLSTARPISKGTSETYSVYGTFSGVSGNSGTQSVTFGLGTKNSFQWNDISGAVNNITGVPMASYPNQTQTKTN